MISQRKTKVACVGDSVTFGYGIDQPEKNSYPSQLQTLLGNSYEVRNFGRSGATLLTKGTLPYVESEEYKKALDFDADFVIIHLGLNDTDPRNWPNYKDSFIQDYLNLIQNFRNKKSKIKIWICRMTPIRNDHPRFLSGTRDWYWQIQQTIEQIAKVANVELIDLQEALYNRPDLLPDALHPNKEGLSLIAKKVYGAITGNYGGLQLPAIYSDNMVLQRGTLLNFEGIANAGEIVTISVEKLDSKKKKSKGNVLGHTKTKTGVDGKWKAQLSDFKAGIGYQLRVSSGKKTILLKNIAFGDVYLCSGQSNMAFELKNEATYNSQTDYTDANIRIFNMLPQWDTQAIEWDKNALESLNKLQYYKPTSWQTLSSENAKDFSAVAYFFGKEIVNNEAGIPIGLIHNAIGGSNIESWVDRKTLEFYFPEIMKDWRNNDFIMPWVRERALQNTKQSEGKSRHPYEPAYLFEAGIEPLNHFPIAGVLWYQGESNAHNVDVYEKLFPLFANSWRNYWSNDTLPIYFVQLSSFERPTWGYFREMQYRLSKTIPNTYMTVSSDLGEAQDIHPRQKKQIGERLARWVLNVQYGRKEITPASAQWKDAKQEKDAILITFEGGEGLQKADTKALQGFEIAEIDGFYFQAEAEIVGEDKIKVYSKKVKNPMYVRYNFAPFANGNLISKNKLPVSTFKAGISK